MKGRVVKLRKMFNRELETLSKNPELMGRVPTDILVGIKFKDGHIHQVFPGDEIAEEIIENAANLLNIEVKGETQSNNSNIPKEVVFHNRQAIGDILTMTCAIRDFKKAFPGTRVGVETTARHLWDYNPYIDHNFRDPDKIRKIGVGFLTNKSNRWNYHMCNAFRLSIEQSLNTQILQGETRPDIWMSEEEYNKPPIIDEPYWIIVVGGAPGWTAKSYPIERWQKVINSLPDIKFLQLGLADKHGNPHYPKLDGVIDFVGKTQNPDTGIRDMFNLFLHAQGSVGLVSMHMHFSAVFNNPCVVIAGAREPSWFTQYMGHQYLQTNGALPCAETKACWYCDAKRCKDNLINGVPKCVDIIQPEEVITAIEKYYDGGRLEYGKKVENNFFKSIVKGPKSRSLLTIKKVEVLIDNKYGIPWGGGSITYKDWPYMKKIIEDYKVKTVLEFGVGLSSLLMSDEVEKIVSYETNEKWIKEINSIAPDNLEIKHWDGFEIKEELGQFDLAFVDGPAGGENREFSTKIASEHANLIIIHDAGRKPERQWQDTYLKPGFKMESKGGHRCHFWKKTSPDAKECVVREHKELALDILTKPLVRFISTARGWGGCARSITTIMGYLVNKGYKVEFIPLHGKYNLGEGIGGEFKDCLNSTLTDVQVCDYSEIPSPCDIMILYADDYVWEFGREDLQELFSETRADRKIMVVNYRRGKIGQIDWTKNWDKYLFLNSNQEQELLNFLPNVTTKVLPPCTKLDQFFEVKPNYTESIKLIRHSSQGNTKFDGDFAEEVEKILSTRPDIELHLMPGPSFLNSNDRIIKYPRNNPPVPEFLSKGNLFYYSLPQGYMDQGPRVILEAMAAGLPVIADNWGGCKERVTEETGWLCDNKSEYIEIIAGLDVNILAEKGQAARERAREEFVPENWIKEIIG